MQYRFELHLSQTYSSPIAPLKLYDCDAPKRQHAP